MSDEEPRAYARHTDPAESHAAAASVSDITGKQSAVLALIRESGPITDHQLVIDYQRQYRERGWPEQSDSGLRTRRNELFRRGYLARDAAKGLLPSGRQAARWRTLRPGEEV